MSQRLQQPEVLDPINLNFTELLSEKRVRAFLEPVTKSSNTTNAFIAGAVVGAVGGYFIKGRLGMALGAVAAWYLFNETLDKTPPPKAPSKAPLGACTF